MFAGPLQGTSLAERLGDAKVRLTVCSQVCPSPCCLRASVALGTLCLVCFRERLQSRWVPCVWSASEMFTGFSRVGYLVFGLLQRCLPASAVLGTLCFGCYQDSILWSQTGAHNGDDPPRTLSTSLQSASRAGVEAFHGPSYFMNLGSPSATSWVAALLCRLQAYFLEKPSDFGQG